MKFGLVMYEIASDWDVAATIANLAQTGFEGIELRTTRDLAAENALGPEKREEIAALFAASTVRIAALSTECTFDHLDAAELQRNIDAAKIFIELAADVGALAVKVRPGGLREDQKITARETIKQIGTALHTCGGYAEDYGIQLLVEVYGPGTSQPAAMRAIMEAADHARVGICWNCNRTDLDRKQSAAAAFKQLQPWVRHVYLHDLFGQGYPYAELFNLLVQAGYDSYIMSEMPARDDVERLAEYFQAMRARLEGTA
ncbi:MAG: sugar phosphate isomerase/epimerase family protein [Planctomycetota bacterium]